MRDVLRFVCQVLWLIFGIGFPLSIAYLAYYIEPRIGVPGTFLCMGIGIVATIGVIEAVTWIKNRKTQTRT